MKQKDFFTSSEYTAQAACNAGGDVYGWLLFNGSAHLETAKGVERVFKTTDSVIALCTSMGATSVNFEICGAE